MTTADKEISEDLHHQMLLLGQAARSSADVLTRADTSSKNAALLSAADSMRSSLATILEANAEDMEGARQRQVSSALLDRLALDEGRVEATAQVGQRAASHHAKDPSKNARVWHSDFGRDLPQDFRRIPCGYPFESFCTQSLKECELIEVKLAQTCKLTCQHVC